MLIISLLIVLPLWGIAGLNIYQTKKLVAEESQKYILRIVQLISYRHEEVINRNRQLLLTLSHIPVVQKSLPECDSLLREIRQEYPSLVNLAVVKVDGEISCSAIEPKGTINILYRPYFQRVLAKKEFVVSNYLISSISGKPVVMLAQPIKEPSNSEVTGVILGSLDLSWLNEDLAKVKLDQEAVLFVVDRNGKVINHYPDLEKWLGKSIKEIFPFERLAEKPQGGSIIASGDDGVLRQYSFASLGGLPEKSEIYVVFGIPKKITNTPINQLIVKNLIFILAANLITFLIVWFGSFLFVRYKPEGTYPDGLKKYH